MRRIAPVVRRVLLDRDHQIRWRSRRDLRGRGDGYGGEDYIAVGIQAHGAGVEDYCAVRGALGELHADAGDAAGGRRGGIGRYADFYQRGAAVGSGAVFEAGDAVLGYGGGADGVNGVVEAPPESN